MFPDSYNNPADQFRQVTKNPFGAVGDWFKSYMNQRAQTTASIRPNNGFYQVGPNDFSMDQVSKSINVPLQTLVSVNGMKSLPPSGSYIATAPPQAPQQPAPFGYGYTGLRGTSGNQSMIQGRGGYTNSIQGVIQQADFTNSSFAAFNEQYRLTGKYNDALLPQGMTLDTVKQLDKSGFFSSATDAEGNALTPAQALAAYGYTFQNGVFTKTGSSGAAAGGRPGPNQAGYNPSGNTGGWTLARNKRGKLVWIRPGARTGDQGPAPAVGTNVGSSPSTVLDIQLQGG